MLSSASASKVPRGTQRLEDQIRQRLYPLELATGAVLTVHAYSRRAWDSPWYRALPFTQRVEQDGIVV